MRQHIYQWSLLLSLLTLAACGNATTNGSATATPSITAISSPTATSTPTPTPPAGFVYFTSADHIYQIAYPAGWQVTNPYGNKAIEDFTGPNQIFEVHELPGDAGNDPAKIANDFCQAMQAGVSPNPVQTNTVSLGGQKWTRADCDAGAQGPAIRLIVEVIFYEGRGYQMDYTSPIVEFASDNKTYYSAMEHSFFFLK